MSFERFKESSLSNWSLHKCHLKDSRNQAYWTDHYINAIWKIQGIKLIELITAWMAFERFKESSLSNWSNVFWSSWKQAYRTDQMSFEYSGNQACLQRGVVIILESSAARASKSSPQGRNIGFLMNQTDVMIRRANGSWLKPCETKSASSLLAIGQAPQHSTQAPISLDTWHSRTFSLEVLDTKWLVASY